MLFWVKNVNAWGIDSTIERWYCQIANYFITLDMILFSKVSARVSMIGLFVLFLFPNITHAQVVSGANNYHAYRLSVFSKLNIQQMNSDGAFRYNKDIAVPPGRNGLQPNISVRYNSQSNDDDSVIGYGWSLSIPNIERLNRRGVDQLYTNHSFGSDLDGELRAINITDPVNGYGTYGARTESGEFLNYEFQSTNTWVVTDKRGTRYRYGSTTASRVDNPSNPSRIARWALDEIRDTNDNFIRFVYTKDSNQLYPASVFYTGHGTVDGPIEVRFSIVQKTVPHVMATYRTGFPVATNYHISEVSTYVSGSRVRRYAFAYTSGDNGSRDMLRSITETGFDQNGVETVLPSDIFTYQQKARTWTQTPGWSNQSGFHCLGAGDPHLEANGDGLPDVLHSVFSLFQDRFLYLNTGSSWVNAPSSWHIQVDAAGSQCSDRGSRFADVNGDGLTDILSGLEGDRGPIYQTVYINNGSDWVASTNWILPAAFAVYRESSGYNYDRGTRIADINGDGRPDIFGDSDRLGVFLNNGTGWTRSTNWVVPFTFTQPTSGLPMDIGAHIIDVNGDGLADLIRPGFSDVYRQNPYKIYFNTGNGWAEDPNWVPPSVLNSRNEIRVADANGDGLPDVLFSTNSNTSPNNQLWINVRHGWVMPGTWTVPTSFAGDPSTPFPAEVRDINGDGLDDIVKPGSPPYAYIADPAKPDLLSQIQHQSGAVTTITYRGSAQERSASGELLNPHLPYVVQVVDRVTVNDGMGNISTEQYDYANGVLFVGDPAETRFAGFGKIIMTDGIGRTETTYYHQGNTNDTASIESGDEFAKIGRKYRTEVRDSSGSLAEVNVIEWGSVDIGNGRVFVKKNRETNFNYTIGSSEHVDTATEWTYNDTNGNVLTNTMYGQVQATPDGTFTDIGTDLLRTTYTYATDASNIVRNAVSQEETRDSANARVRLTTHYYDNLPLGSVSVGNETRTSKLISSTGYQTVTRVFNNFGLVTSETDPLNHTTSYTYDAFNLYPITITNALGQATQYTYDYSLGKPTVVIDPNGSRNENIYDGLDRTVSVRQSDPNNPGQTMLVKQVIYTDNANPRSIRELSYLDSDTNAVEKITYIDGFNRTIQTRTEAVSSGYNVVDTVYDQFGRKQRESLPYPSSGSVYTPPTTNTSLLTTYTYDPLNRPTAITTILGDTTNSYANWTVTTTDALGNIKATVSDAYGRLTAVHEMNGASLYRTRYVYNGNNALTTITDASGNVRTFTYDYLGRRTRANDWRTGGDTSFGYYIYTYDPANNVTTEVTPRGDSIAYVYDPLNRVTRETVNNAQSPSVTYTYDNCTNGIGRLCTVTTPDITTNYSYDILGRVITETKTISGRNTPFVTAYTYDRQGNVFTQTIDGQTIVNTYNNAGLTESISANNNPVINDVVYTPTNQIAEIGFANNTRTTNTYDQNTRYRLTQKQTLDPNGLQLQQVAYTYDAVGNILTMDDTSNNSLAKQATYTYDPLYRLTQAVISNTINNGDYTQNFTYNAIGNILTGPAGTYLYQGSTITGSYANPHAATNINGITKTYDQNGNMTADNLGHTYSWDYRNRLTQATNTDTNTVTNYSYDQNNDRVKTTAADGTITFYPNKNTDVTGNTTTIRISLGDAEVASITTGSPINFVHTDHLGGTSIVTDETGNKLELIDYQPYGKIRTNDYSTPQSTEKKKFTGYRLDDETGLYYANARYYDPAIGRFLSEDPVHIAFGDRVRTEEITRGSMEKLLTDPQLLNSYSYAKNNPIVYKDPEGEYVETAFDVAMFGLSLNDFREKPSFWNGVAVLADGASLVLPIPAIVGGIRHADDAARLLKRADVAGDLVRGGNRAADFAGISRRYNWGNPNTLEGHTLRHASDFGLAKDDYAGYAQKTNDFISNKQYTNVFKEGKDTVYWNKDTNIAVFTNRNGQVSSGYKVTNENKINSYKQRATKQK